ISPYAALFVVVPAMFVVGLLVQRLLIQPLLNEPMMQIFATFGLLIFLENFVLMLTQGAALGIPSDNGPQVISLLGNKVSIAQIFAFAASTLIAIGLHLFLNHTMMGKAIRAVTQDKRA